MIEVEFMKSNIKTKKLTAVFYKDNKKIKTSHFGSAGMDDYTITKDKEQRKRYRDRHRKDLKTGDFKKPGFLSFYTLWGASTSRKTNMRSYAKRFKLKIRKINL